MNLLIPIIIVIIVAFFLCIYYYPAIIFFFLRKRLTKIITLVNKLSDPGLQERMAKDFLDRKEANSEEEGLQKSVIFNLTLRLAVIETFQDELLKIERLSDFAPRFWWPEKYYKEMEELKKQTRELRTQHREKP